MSIANGFDTAVSPTWDEPVLTRRACDPWTAAEVVRTVPDRRTNGWRMAAITGITLAVDAAAVGLAYLVTGMDHPTHLATGLVWLAAFAAYGLYDRRSLTAPLETPRRLFHAVSVATIAVVTIAFGMKWAIPRLWIASLWAVALLAAGTGRVITRALIRRLSSAGVLGARVLVVGTNAEARGIARALDRQPFLGHHVVGFVSVEASSFPAVDGRPVLAGPDAIAEAVKSFDAGSVIVAGSAVPADQLPSLINELLRHDLEIRLSAGLPHVAASRVRVEPLDGVAVLSVRQNQLSGRQAALKRAVDLVGSAALLIALAPVLVAVGLIVRLTDGGPAIFRQVRVGEGGRPFTIYKFRTMRVDADDLRDQLAASNQADGVLFKMVDDPRVTGPGRLLRRWGLDELPQLFNVLRGDMSLVGPRPPLPDETARYDEWVAGRLRVKPGITGLWQVNGRHQLTWDDYVRYDLFYVENWSLGLDLLVLARTLPAVVSGRGAA